MLLHSLAIGTSITWGGLFGSVHADEPASLRPSSSRPVLMPVQATSAPLDSDGESQFQSSRRPAANRQAPLPFEPPTAISRSEPSTSTSKATTPPMGVWVPRGSRALRTSTAQRFTPWTTPDIDRRSTSGSMQESSDAAPNGGSSESSRSETKVHRSESVQESGSLSSAADHTPPSMRRETTVRSQTERSTRTDRIAGSVQRNTTTSETIVVNPTVDDPAPAPSPGTLSERTETTETLETKTETSRRTRVARRDSSQVTTEQHSSSRRSTETEELQMAAPREVAKLEIEALVPVQSPDSNEPIDDVVEPNESQPVPEEEVTDGDIDAESLERLRAAIRSFPGRSAAREDLDSDEAASSPSDRMARALDSTGGKQDDEPAPQKRRARVLTREVQTLRPHIARVLTDYHRRPENVSGRSPWGTFHMMLPFGADANVQSGRNLHNSIAWLCSNRPCRGQRLITTTKSGRIYVRQGPGLQGHQAQLLAMLAQVNVEATYPITTGRSRFTIEDLIRAEMADCRRGQELTFSLIGLSHYLPTDTHWRASDGSVWNFETLLAEELAQPIVGAACGGTHRLMGLSYALRQRRMEGLPIEGQWLRADAFIKDFVNYAWSLQNSDGSFSTNWFEGPQDNRELDRKVQTTGHILEWLIFTADQDELQDPRFVRGVQFLTNAFSRYRTHEWQPGPKGHVLRALSLYHRRVYGDPRPWASPSQVAQPAGRAYR
ncbi:hypothetical protein [Rosistilla ulvae]|nr:hypothetical protein [Rosistilla ulvae]